MRCLKVHSYLSLESFLLWSCKNYFMCNTQYCPSDDDVVPKDSLTSGTHRIRSCCRRILTNIFPLM